jgi:pimeloyl-ACP methyl ester carboxylesterase
VTPVQSAVAVDGVTLQLRVWPAADPARPAVVLLPGTGETAEDWDVVAAALQPSRTVYAVNLRGHGPSDWPGEYSIQAMADDVAGLLRQLDDRPVDLVGHSLGGLVACAVASAHPESVRRLVLEDVGVPHPRVAAAPERPAGELPFDWRVVEQVRPEIDDPDPRWAEVVARMSAPVLVIAGGPSSHVPQDGIAELVRAVPDGRQVDVDAGHLVHETRPDEFTLHLVTFLDA